MSIEEIVLPRFGAGRLQAALEAFAQRRERVRQDEGGDERIVAGIACIEPRQVLAAGREAFRAEAGAAAVRDVGVVAEHVAPAVAGGAQAEVVFLAVAASEGGTVEIADGLDRGAA